jgi:FlaG/FlaF family flagellin (archaellin)
MKRLQKQDDGVSEILGTALLIGIAILFFSILVIIVFSYPQSPAAPFVNIIGSIDAENDLIILEHFGGDFLDEQTQIFITINDQVHDVSVQSIFNTDETLDKWKVFNSNYDGVWNFGEIVTYSAAVTAGMGVSVAVVDDYSDQVVMTAMLQRVPITEKPSVITLDASSVTESSADLRMYYDFVNYSGQLWFRYKTLADTTWSLTSTVSKSGSGYLLQTISDLQGNAEYQFRAYLRYGATEIQGDMHYFSTNPLIVSTFVDPIIPYDQFTSPISLTATNVTDVDNVSLYYRWSNGNWTGESVDVLGFDDFEIGTSNWSYANAIRTNSLSRSGSYSIEFPGNNYIDFSADFSSYLAIDLSFWIFLDKIHPGDIIQVKFFDGIDTVVVQTFDNTEWQLNQWNHVVLEIKAVEYTFSSDSRIIIDLAVKNSHFIDDVYVNVTSVETMIDWELFAIDEDDSDGWGWDFTVPRDSGFYQFYSIGFLAGSQESVPGGYDARCRYVSGGP